MNCFIAVFKFDGKRLLDRKPLIILLMLLVFVLGFFQKNISEFKDTQEQKRIFQDIEKKRVEQLLNYRVYGVRGFQIFFLPDSLSLFFVNSITIPEMSAYADSSEQLNIRKPITIKNVFDLRKNWFTDYSGILFLIGSLLILFYGYPALKSSEYLRLPDSITGHKNFFGAVFFARGLWLLVILLAFLACLILLAALNGIMIAIDQYLLIFLLVSYCLSMLIFSVGFWCGTWKSDATGMATALIIWMTFVFFIPTFHNLVNSIKSISIKPSYQFDMLKLIVYMDWEKKMRENEGIMKLGEKPSESVKKRMLEYKENELRKLQAMEEDQIAQLERNKTFYQLLASFFPTTFYQSVNNEVSSRGYENLVDFCKYALGEKLKFIGIVIEKEYFSNYSKVEQFNAGNDNVYTARPKLPEFFILGIFFNLLWISGFVIAAYRRSKKNLSELEEKKKNDPDVVEVKLDTVDVNSFQADNDLITRQLYNFLSDEPGEFQKKGYSLKVTVNDKVLNMAEQKKEFLYLCHPSELPGDTKTGNYLDFIMDLMGLDKTKRKDISSRFDLTSIRSKKLKRLDDEQMGKVYRAILEMKQYPIYLFGDTFRKMGWEFCYPLVEKMISLTNDGSIIIHIFENMDTLYTKKSKSCWFHKTNLWINQVMTYSGRHDDE